MRCSQCLTELTEGSKFCNECGRKIACMCPECGKISPSNSNFCLECGRLMNKEPESDVPSTEQGVIAARLERLGRERSTFCKE